MKKHLYLFFSLLVPIALYAQPTITDMDNFNPGNFFKRGICDPTGIGPGTGGASQHWNFTNLQFTDTETVRILAPSSTSYGSQFPTASFAMYSDYNQQYIFINKSSAANGMIGFVDTAANVVMNYNANSALMSKRPIAYNDNVLDTFVNTLSNPPVTMTGGGTVSINADGWGMLHLPDSAFMDVLRVKTVAIQRDSLTFPIPQSVDIIRTTYSWYANGYTAPVLIWDSLDVSGSLTSNVKTVSYLITGSLGTKNITKNTNAFTGKLGNSNLLLNGSFENGISYKAELVNIEGRKLFSSVFTARNGSQSFDLQQEVSSGIYFVSIMKANDISSHQILKLVKE